MTDRNRNHDQQNPGQQQSSPGSERQDDLLDLDGSESTARGGSHDRRSVADDRGVDDNRERRNPQRDREDVDVGSDMENAPGVDDRETNIDNSGNSSR